MNNCICCHDRLLRHISHHRVYWFCPTCYMEELLEKGIDKFIQPFDSLQQTLEDKVKQLAAA